MVFSAGITIGQYRIGRKLGAGGMGDVYAATHLMLGREIALKTLSAHEIRTDSAVARFIQEARSAATLIHPNIVTVHDVGDHEGTLYIAMELVDGSTLRDVLSQRALRPREVVRYAIQIANGLAAAHAAGILHRDIKPANIMITRRNQVKVLDFGLAKNLAPAGSDRSASTTLTTDPNLTERGYVAGTATYMSPEQAQGFPVDVRSDIFSFGIVLYEMLTGTHPFDAPSKAGVLANILRSEPPPLDRIALDTPRELEDVIRFCLRKAPEERAHSMHDVAFMLEKAAQVMEHPRVSAAGPDRRRRWAIAGIVSVLALISAAGAGAFVASRRNASASLKPTLRRITWDAGLADNPALSNDGHFLAFSSDRADGRNLDIYIRHVDGGEPIRLTSDPADDTDPSFSPDGGLIAFHSERRGGGVYVVPSFGGQERLIAPRGNRPRFSPDGKWIAYWVGEEENTKPSGRIFIVSAADGETRQLQPSFAASRYPVWTSDGAHILFEGVDVWKSDSDPSPDWWVTSINGGAPVRTGAWETIKRSGPNTIYEPGGWRDGKVVFSARHDTQRSVYAIPISMRTWKVLGLPEALTFGTGTDGVPYPSPIGAMAFASYQYEINVWSHQLDDNGGIADKQGDKLTTGDAYHSSVSMDTRGTRLVYLLGRPPNRNVWIRDVEAARETTVTADAAGKCGAAISPDASRVAWSVCGPGREPIYVAAVNRDLSVSVPEVACDDCGRIADWSPLGDSILFVDHSSPARIGILALSTGARSLIASARYSLDSPRFSPDANWLALTAVHKGDDRARILAIPLRNGKPGPESEWIGVTDGNSWDDKPVWTRNSENILFYSRRDGFGCIWRQSVNRVTRRAEGPPAEVLPFHGIRLSFRPMSSDLASLTLVGDRLLFNALDSTGNVWVLDANREKGATHGSL